MNRLSLKRFFWIFIFIIINVSLVSPYAVASSISVDIIGPATDKDLLPNTKYTFLVRVKYSADFYDLKDCETDLSVKVYYGSFVGGTGTFQGHFETLPNEGSDPAVYISTSDFRKNTSKIAVVNIKTASYGYLQIEATAQVSGRWGPGNIFSFSETAEATRFEAHIKPSLGGKEPEALFKDLAVARKAMAERFIQFYNKEVGVDETAISDEAIEMMSYISGLGDLMGSINLLATSGPGEVLFDRFLSYLDPLSNFVQFTFNLMEEYENATWRILWNDMFGGGIPLVNDDNDNPGYLNQLVKELDSEASAWEDKDYAGILDHLENEQRHLMCIKMTAENVLSSMGTEHELSRAFFEALEEWASAELDALAEIRANALVLKYGIFSADCMSPSNGENGVDTQNAVLGWTCSNISSEDAGDISFRLYLKKAADSEYQIFDTAETQFTPTLDEGTIYNWKVEAVFDSYVLNATCGNNSPIKTFPEVTISSEAREFTTKEANQPPVIIAIGHGYSGDIPLAPLLVTFTCNAYDPDGSITAYKWDFDGDGNIDQTTTGDSVNYTYNNAGTYNATVTVVDDDGAETSIAVTITVEQASGTPGTKKWDFQTAYGGVRSSPAIGADGTIYMGSDDGKLYAINSDGTKKWEFQTGDDIISSPAISTDGTIYVGSCDGKLYAINLDGTKKWEFQTAYAIWSSPAIGADGTIYVGSKDNKFYAINPDGTKKWEFETGDEIWTSPAIGLDGTIYVGSFDHKLYAINPDGTKKWEFYMGDWFYSKPASPAIGADGTIYIGSHNHNLYAINSDGTKKWEFETGNFIYSSPAIGSDGTVYVGSWDQKLYAIKPDGTKKWEFETASRINSSPAIGLDGTIYVGSFDHKLYAINPDGTKKWDFETGDDILSSPVIASDGTIYVGSEDNKLYAIYSDSYGLADSPWPMFHHDVRHTGWVRSGEEIPNQSPVIDSFTASLSSGEAPLTVDFTCQAHDPDGTISEYRWDFDGDGTTDKITSTSTLSHTYSNPGMYNAICTVVDSREETSTSTPVTITVNLPPGMSAQWIRTYGSTDGERASCILKALNGNFIIAGSTNAFGAGDSDLLVMKLDPFGNILWQKTYGGTGFEYMHHNMHPTHDGGYIVIGTTRSFGAGEEDIWVLKLNADGEVEWQKTYGGWKGEWGMFIEQTDDDGDGQRDDGYILCGHASSFGAGYWDTWVIKLNSEGGIQWQKTFGGWLSEYTQSIHQTPDGGFIFAGETQNFGTASEYKPDIWVIKLNSNGEIEWQKTYGGPGADQMWGPIQLTSDGGYIVLAYTTSFGAGKRDVWIIKLDSSGNPDWQKTYGGSEDDTPTHIIETGDGGYVVCGYTSSFGNGGSDAWIFKLDPDGSIAWEKTYGGSNNDSFSWISTTYDGGFIAAGSTKSYGKGESDIWILKLDSYGDIADADCSIKGSSSISVMDTSATVTNNINVSTTNSSGSVSNTDIMPGESGFVVNELCSAGGPANQSPVILSFTADPSTGFAPLAVTFICQALDQDGTITEYRWDFNGDGTTDRTTDGGATVYTYTHAGIYNVRVTVVDEQGAEASSSITITVTLKGDIDADGIVELSDAILALQVVSGMEPQGIRSDYASSGVDINGDGRIGIEEVIYVMEKLSGLR